MDECSMVVGIVVLAVVGMGILFFFWHKKNRCHDSCSQKREKEQTKGFFNQQQFQKKVRIRVERNDRCQINIYCYNLEQEKLGELLAEYTWDNSLLTEKKASAVHLEQLFVQRRQRKKGIGKLMFAYLIQEMLVLEEQSGKEFLQIYGEVGRDGMDEPRSSIPFYKKMSSLPYGERRALRLQFDKGAALDGLDAFTYHIVRK